jgi:putative endonuclease
MGWIVYILRSELTGKYYHGSCGNLEKRLAEHNAGKTRSTKAYRPWVKTYVEIFENKTDALKREKYFKTRSGFRWLKEHNII